MVGVRERGVCVSHDRVAGRRARDLAGERSPVRSVLKSARESKAIVRGNEGSIGGNSSNHILEVSGSGHSKFCSIIHCWNLQFHGIV